MNLIQIKCQEVNCPYGKQCDQRCIFGEVYKEDISDGQVIRERHKCPRAKRGQLQYVTVVLKIA